MTLKGCLALCSRDQLGVITSDSQIEIEYGDGTKDFAWVGFHVKDGSPWSSRAPEVIGFVGGDLESVRQLCIPREGNSP